MEEINTHNRSTSYLQKSVTVVNLIYTSIAIICLFVSVYVGASVNINSMQKDISAQEEALREVKVMQEKDRQEFRQLYKDQNVKLDAILDRTTEIKIELQNKQNRP